MQSLNFFKALGAFASLLAFSDAAAVTTAGSVCTQEPYSPFLSLSQNYLAEAYCTSYYPQPTPAITSTMTITKSSISTVNVTSTLSVAYTTVNASAAVTKFTTMLVQLGSSHRSPYVNTSKYASGHYHNCRHGHRYRLIQHLYFKSDTRRTLCCSERGGCPAERAILKSASVELQEHLLQHALLMYTDFSRNPDHLRHFH